MIHFVLGFDSKSGRRCEGLAACWSCGIGGSRRLPPASGRQASSCCALRSPRGSRSTPAGPERWEAPHIAVRPCVKMMTPANLHSRPTLSFKLNSMYLTLYWWWVTFDPLASQSSFKCSFSAWRVWGTYLNCCKENVPVLFWLIIFLWLNLYRLTKRQKWSDWIK